MFFKAYGKTGGGVSDTISKAEAAQVMSAASALEF